MLKNQLVQYGELRTLTGDSLTIGVRVTLPSSLVRPSSLNSSSPYGTCSAVIFTAFRRSQVAVFGSTQWRIAERSSKAHTQTPAKLALALRIHCGIFASRVAWFLVGGNWDLSALAFGYQGL